MKHDKKCPLSWGSWPPINDRFCICHTITSRFGATETSIPYEGITAEKLVNDITYWMNKYDKAETDRVETKERLTIKIADLNSTVKYYISRYKEVSEYVKEAEAKNYILEKDLTFWKNLFQEYKVKLGKLRTKEVILNRTIKEIEAENKFLNEENRNIRGVSLRPDYQTIRKALLKMFENSGCGCCVSEPEYGDAVTELGKILDIPVQNGRFIYEKDNS